MASSPSAAVAASLASGGVESLGWLNDLVAQLWDYMNTAGAAMVKETVEPMFKETLPGPLSSLHFEKIDLGKVPIKFDNIDVHTKKKGLVKLDLDVIWDGDCNIKLKANLTPPFGVKSVKLKGRLSVVQCPLIDRLPIVSAIQVAFINPPELDLDFTGLAEVADFSIIDKSIRKIIQDVLASLMVLPTRMLIKMDPANDYFDTYQEPLGVIRVTAVKGQGFKVQGRLLNKDVPDVYLMVNFGTNPTWKTSTVKNSTSPEWNESRDFLLSDEDQIISFDVYDDDGLLDGDDFLGRASISVGDLLLAGKTKELSLKTKEGISTGSSVTISCDIYRFTPDLASFESPDHQAPNRICGLLTVLVVRTFDVPVAKEEAASSVKVTFGKVTFITAAVVDAPGVDALNPSYDTPFLVPLTDEMAASLLQPQNSILFTLMNGKDVIGTTGILHALLLESPDQTVTAKVDIGQGAKLEFRVSVCGLHQSD